MSTENAPNRRYDKGRDRWKHVGKDAWPIIVYDASEPRKYIGKCPNKNALPDSLRAQLLNEAIAASNGDRSITYDKILFAIHKGVIYAAQTSDGGITYHGYPYRGKLSGEMIARLEKMAIEKDCEKDFRQWVKTYIIRHGERR